MSETGLIAVAAGLFVLCAFMAVTGVRRDLRLMRIAEEGHARERELVALADRRHRAYWTSPTTWIDPDCFECGGEGAPCCDPPTYPWRKEREGTDFGGDGWTTPIPPQSPEQIIARLHELDAEDEANPDPRPLGEPVQIFDKRPARPSADLLWKALDDMTGQFPVIRPEDPDRR